MNTRMQFLEHELAMNERNQQQKSAAQASATASPALSPASPTDSEQVLRLERKVRELEAMVNGITEELLDLKTITRKLTTTIEKLGSVDPLTSAPKRSAIRRPVMETASNNTPAPAVGRAPSRTQPSIRQPAEQRVASAAAPAVAHAPVMQNQDTPLPSEEEISAAAKPGQFEYVMQPDGTIQKRPKKSSGNVIIAGAGFSKGHVSRSSAIRAESSAVIEADEDDTVEIQ